MKNIDEYVFDLIEQREQTYKKHGESPSLDTVILKIETAIKEVI